MKPLPIAADGQLTPTGGGVNCMRTVVAAAVACLLGTGLAAAADVHAAIREATKIPAQGLGPALQTLSRDRKIHLVYVAEDVKGRQTQGANGDLRLDEALQQLLQGTGLTYQYIDEATVSILPVTDTRANASSRGNATSPGDVIRIGNEGGLTTSASAGIWEHYLAQNDQGAPVSGVQAGTATSESGTEGKSRPEIEEIVVTAQKREEKLQNVPIAITALSGEELTRKGITTFEGVAQATPSITFVPYNNSSNTLTVYMRGQGFIDPGQITADGAVGLYEDGFYVGRPQASTFDLADIERVEVLRGPQGTLYGRNTTGGAVNLISKAPSGEFGFKETLDFGNRNLFRSLTAVDLPAWRGVSAKLTLLKSAIDGNVKNIGPSHDYGEEEQQAGRIRLLWRPMDNVQVDYFFEKVTIDSTPIYYQAPAFNGLPLFNENTPYFSPSGPATETYRPVDLRLSTSDFYAHGLTLAWNASDALTIKSLTGYRELTWDGIQDYVEVFGIPYAGSDSYRTHQFSEELQFIGNLSGGGIRYVGGLYYFNEGGAHHQVYHLGLGDAIYIPMTDISMDSTSKAAYGQVTWTPGFLERRFELTLGGRYTRDEKSASRILQDNFNGLIENGKATGSTNSQSFSRFNPALIVSYQWTDELNTYGKVVTGYKAGGSLESAPPGRFTQTFGPEDVTTYELGLKSYWFGRRLRANMTAFDTRLEGLQLFLGADALATYFQAYNAGDSTIRGAELELQVTPVDDLNVSFSYTHLDPQIDRINVIAGTTLDSAINPASPYQPGDNVKDLFTVPYSPSDSFDLGFDCTIARFSSGRFSANADYRWQSRVYFTAPAGPGVPNRQLASIPSYGTLDARVTLDFDLPRGDRASISIWGKNVTNKNYYQSEVGIGAGPVPIQSVDPETGEPITIPAGYVASGFAWSEPPAYGISLMYQY